MPAALRSYAGDGGREHNASANRTAGGVLCLLCRACRSAAIWLGFAGRMDAGEGLG